MERPVLQTEPTIFVFTASCSTGHMNTGRVTIVVTVDGHGTFRTKGLAPRDSITILVLGRQGTRHSVIDSMLQFVTVGTNRHSAPGAVGFQRGVEYASLEIEDVQALCVWARDDCHEGHGGFLGLLLSLQ